MMKNGDAGIFPVYYSLKEPPSPLQTTVSFGIILSHGHKSTATSAKRQFDTSNYVHHKIKDL